MQKQLVSMLSEANRNGFLKAGEMTCGTALSSGKTQLIVVAKNASQATKAKFGQLGYKYDVEVILACDVKLLSWVSDRNNSEVIAILDKEVADNLKNLLEEMSGNE